MSLPFASLEVGRIVIIFLAVLGPLVLVHELGHFLTARLFGVKVLEFGFGFPPRLFGIRRGETLYSVNLLPLGGFVKLLGEEDPTEPRSLARQAPWKRFIILASGSFMNALLPVAILAALFMVPQRLPAGQVILTQVAPGGPAAQAGLGPGDRIISVNGQEARFSGEVGYLVHLNLGKEMVWEVQQGQATRQVRLVPRLDTPPDQGPTGVQLTTARVRVEEVPPPSSAAQLGLRPGDLLVGVGDLVLPSHDALPVAVDRLKEMGVEEVDLLLWRQGELVQTSVPGGPDGVLAALGATTLSTQPDRVLSYPLWQAIPRGAMQIWETLVLAKNEVVRWFAGTSQPQLTGPVGIAQLSGEVASQGLLPLLSFIAFLSINLAILNILPIPMLDGGRLMFVVLEWVRRGKRVSPQREGFVHLIGFALLLSVIVVISYFDVLRLLRGESLLR